MPLWAYLLLLLPPHLEALGGALGLEGVCGDPLGGRWDQKLLFLLLLVQAGAGYLALLLALLDQEGAGGRVGALALALARALALGVALAYLLALLFPLPALTAQGLALIPPRAPTPLGLLVLAVSLFAGLAPVRRG